MGCWNGTCGITQLPIFSGDPVVVFLLIENRLEDKSEWAANGHCYANQYWTTRSIQLYGEYNDYGWFDFDDDWNSQFTLNAFQDDLVEMELGENKYHDISVTKKSLDSLELVGEAIHEDRLFVHSVDLMSNKKMNRTIGTFAVHRRVFDAIVELGIDLYSGDITVKTMMKSAKEYIEKQREYVLSDTFSSVSFDFGIGESASNVFGGLFGRGSGDWGSVTGSHVLYRDKIRSMIIAGATDKEFVPILEELSKYYIFSSAMGNLRKTWMPQAGSGSQADGLDVHKAVMNAALSRIKDYEDDIED